MKKGLFITIEGPDGSGKSTQIEKIQNFFTSRGFETVFTREPGGTKISEKIRDILLDKENSEMDYNAEALLYAASRAQLVSQVIKPALEEGKVVICDRFIDSSIAYQGYGRGLGDGVITINEYAIQGCMPDLTVLMKLNPEIGRGRINDEDADRLESESIAFHKKVYEGYLEIEKKYSTRVFGVDASGSIDEIASKIEAKLLEVVKMCEE